MRHWSFLDDERVEPEEFSPREKLGAMLALALAAILFVAFLAAFGPMDAPSPNTVGLKDLR